MKLSHLLAAVCLSGLSAMAQAADTAVPYSLTTTQPRTNNFHFDSGQPCSIHTGGGEGGDLTAPYTVVSYQVTVGGSYSFSDFGLLFNDGPDGSLGVFNGNFDPANPEVGCVGSVDDNQDITLTPGVYTLVLTTLDGMNPIPGDFEYRISGPAALVPVATTSVPVPTLSESLLIALMLLLGACGMGAVAQRQRQSNGL